MKIPTITEMRFPKTEEGKKLAYRYIVGLVKSYPDINTELIENLDHIVLLITYCTDFGGKNEQKRNGSDINHLSC